MYFLCPAKRQKLVKLPENQLSDHWLEWMIQAGNHYEAQDWKAAIPLAECALDVTSSALMRSDVSKVNVATEATLSALYVSNILAMDGRENQIQEVCENLSRRIIVRMFNGEHHVWAETCVDVINDRKKQANFFTEYLSLPFETPQGGHEETRQNFPWGGAELAKIRYGCDPNNPALISNWLKQNGEDLPMDQRRQWLEKQFYVLLDTIADDLVPRQWRCICLDNIYKPLCALRKLSNDEFSIARVRQLSYELSTTGRFVERSLNYNVQ